MSLVGDAQRVIAWRPARVFATAGSILLTHRSAHAQALAAHRTQRCRQPRLIFACSSWPLAEYFAASVREVTKRHRLTPFATN